MHLPNTLLTTLLLPLLTTAHFVMHYPTSRNGDDDEIEVKSPCSGLGLSSNRTTVSLPSFPIALEMGHDETVIQVLLSLSDDPSSEADFNVTLERTFQQDGLGAFCLPEVRVPESAGLRDGANATLQVVTDAEGGGGLYVLFLNQSSNPAQTTTDHSVSTQQCADITFTSAPQPLPSSCKNNTGVTASALPANDNINANDSNAEGQPQASGSGSAGASGSGSAASATSSGNGAAVQTAAVAAAVAGWGVIGAGVVGAVALL
ncbi:uncharacterized protein HMPREF1541_04285 [Cyphellophora europaea CBS 101466]|uniref:Copper acquisition factor BIM1-like domain-containing protein n=1 Tax=Cyphellophora europaea (strain CBS 101466) TaxID=1220924 RepID=W2RUM7_CYPE1|nr:uncharacterized protein HMPREF1541_04285 [Cyphellophora europaea CBS 101466]ETN40010.1 hypothetical protein HMPREF1541_04285 [Cyphellophora europaea CBS 101466]